MKLQDKLIYCRKRAGFSQVDLSDKLGVSRQAVSKWETGESNPDLSKLPILAELYGVTTDWLLSDEGIPDAGSFAGDAAAASPNMAQSAPASASPATLPDWVDKLPNHMLQMVKRFGWLYGLRLAGGGLLLLAFGFFARKLFEQFLFGEMFNMGVGGFGPEFFDNAMMMQQNIGSWKVVELFTLAPIVLGGILIVVGLILALLLYRWGHKEG